MSDLEPENNIPRELFREIIRSQYPDTQYLSDEKIDELIDSGEMQLQVLKFTPESSKKMFNILDSGESEEDILNSVTQQVMFLNEHGVKEEIETDGPVKFYTVGEKKITGDDTSDVEPMSPDELKKLFDEN